MGHGGLMWRKERRGAMVLRERPHDRVRLTFQPNRRHHEVDKTPAPWLGG